MISAFIRNCIKHLTKNDFLQIIVKFISWYISTSFNGSQVWNIISDNSINLMHFYLMQPLMRVTSRSLFGNVGNLLNNVRPIYSCCQVL